MKRKKISAKVWASIMAAAMVMSTCPTAAFAVTADKVAADGTYTATKHVYKTAEDADDDWNEYDVDVTVSVEDGKISDITATPKNGYSQTDNASYFNKAYNKTKGIQTLLKGKDATEDTINGWSTVSGATRTSQAIKDAALEAINGAAEVAPYQYVYAAVPYNEYWSAEGVLNGSSVASNEEKDINNEYDKGAFDAVSRATTNHGLYRGSFQQAVTVYLKDGPSFQLSHFEDGNAKVMVTTDGKTVGYENKQFTIDGKTYALDHYTITGIKYVPVKVATADYKAFKAAYNVVENGQTVEGGSSNEGNVKNYSNIANVTENTNGLKVATKNADGTFSFSARQTGTDSGLKDTELKKISQEALDSVEVVDSSKFGDCIRVDITKDYGDLGAHMQTVEWKYYGSRSTSEEPVATFGTKFAADDWMHSKLGIQLGLTESDRYSLPEGYDGTGTWTVTIYALGYEDTTLTVNVTADDIHIAHAVSDYSKLEAAVKEAQALEEDDYTAESWANFATELGEAQDTLAAAKGETSGTTTQEAVDEDLEHLQLAQAALVKETYVYAYAAVSYDQYWAAENVLNGDKTTSSDEKDVNNEYDRGAFDAVSRATTNHGLYRGSFQQDVTVYLKGGPSFQLSHFEDGNAKVMVTSDGKTVGYENKQFTIDGQTYDLDHYTINGIKYVPVKVAASDYEAFKQQYAVVENGQTVEGGSSNEGNVKNYSNIANVTKDTNGLKKAVKNADGTFSFDARRTGTDSGLQGTELKKISQEALDSVEVVDSSKFGDCIRVDITKDYGDLGAHMQTVEWKYYGDRTTEEEPIATFGTKFAADDWMHSKLGIQLGLTESDRFTLPEGYNGTGTWTVTIYALGYEDTTLTVNVTADDIHAAHLVSDYSKLEAAVEEAKQLNEEDYTAETWANFATELGEAEATLSAAKGENGQTTTQEAVDEDLEHLQLAMAALEKADRFTGLANEAAADGNWYYYTNGDVDEEMTGLAQNANGWFYVKDGKVDFSYTGLVQNESGWWYVQNGAISFAATGLVYDSNYGWWYVNGSAIDFGYTGLVNDSNYGWWYVTGGAVNFGYTGLVYDSNYGWWYVTGGAVNFGYTGLVYDSNCGWWYVTGGTVNFGYTGLVYDNNYGWWYVEGGAINFGYNSLVPYAGSWWKVTGGMVDFGFTGVVNYYGTNYRVVNGQVQF